MNMQNASPPTGRFVLRRDAGEYPVVSRVVREQKEIEKYNIYGIIRSCGGAGYEVFNTTRGTDAGRIVVKGTHSKNCDPYG